MYGRGSYNRGGGRDVEGGNRYSDTNANILEQQNNEKIYELSEQVSRLKGLTIDIGNEVVFLYWMMTFRGQSGA